MSRQLLIGLIAEGPTDKRFLIPLIGRVFRELALQCDQAVDVFDVTAENLKREDVPAYLLAGARQFYDYYDILCIHVDADAPNDQRIRKEKLEPGLAQLANAEGNLIRVIVPIIPVRTIENWMLADREQLRKNIGTDLTAAESGFDRAAENYPKPKDTIKEAIRRNAAQRPGRRNQMHIGELYEPLGAQASIEELLKLPSFQKFYAAARRALVDLNLLVE